MNIPGFVDLQVNGYKGVDFSSPDLTEESFARACRDLLAQGTAAFLPTIVTSPVEAYQHSLPLVAAACAKPEFDGRLLGIHVEGPFISRVPGAYGAHNLAWVRDPDIALLDRMHEWAAGRIRILTVAADAPGAEELIRHACGLGITVSLGHQMATDEDLAGAVRAGASALTHLGNGVPGVLPRHENPIWAGLANENLWAMIITDGHHLPPPVLKVMLRAKGAGRVAVVSDQSSVAGLPPGRYHALGADVVLEPSGLLHIPERGCLAGSASTMLMCINHLASLDLVGPEDLEALGFYNPLRIIGVAPATIPAAPRVTYDAGRRRFRLIG